MTMQKAKEIIDISEKAEAIERGEKVKKGTGVYDRIALEIAV